MSLPIVVVGCGGHGREAFGIFQAVAAAGGVDGRIFGFVDDSPSATNLDRVNDLGVPYLGPVSWLAQAPPQTRVVLGLGDPRVRRSVAERVDRYDIVPLSLVHPAATIGPDVVAGAGLLVFAGARVTTNVRLGRHVHLNQNCTVGHDSVFEDFVSVHPLAAVSGDCQLGSGTLVGTTAAVLQGRTTGRDAVVGAGACVVRDVPAGATVKGVPAR